MAGAAEIISKEEIEEIGEKIVSALRRNFETKNLNDTKEGSNSLSSKVKGDTLIIEGLARVLFVEFGRRPGKFPDLDAIKAWVKSKLNVEEEQVDTVAYLVGKKIQDEGTDILKNRARGLQMEITVSNILNQTLEDVTSSIAENITGGLVTSWIQE